MSIQGKGLDVLQGAHQGDTAYVIGCGPSLKNLNKEYFNEGIIFCINDSIESIRELGLPNMTYTMQKDKCITPPIFPERLLVHEHESRDCYADYPEKYVFISINWGIIIMKLNLPR